MSEKIKIKPVLTFRTAKGSRYWLDRQGRSQRYKFYHRETRVKGQGLKELYKYIIFVNNADADYILDAIDTRYKWWMVIRNKQLYVVTAKTDTQIILSGPFEIFYYPRMGLSPIEIMDIEFDEFVKGHIVQKYFHIGNQIVELEILVDLEANNHTL